MTVEEGHVMNIDGSASTIQGSASATTAAASSSTGAKYKPVSTQGDGGGGGGRLPSGVGRNSLFPNAEGGGEDALSTGGGGPPLDDRVSVLSGASGRSKTASQLEAAAKMLPWYKGITCKDLRDIAPTVLILLGGLLIMIFVIPYAFSSVIKQLEASEANERARQMAKQVNVTQAIANVTKAVNESLSTTAPPPT